jgi:hypothetical protein
VSLLSHQRSFVYDDMQDLLKKGDTLGSDEGVLDIDNMPDEYLMEDLDYLVPILHMQLHFGQESFRPNFYSYNLGQLFIQTLQTEIIRKLGT